MIEGEGQEKAKLPGSCRLSCPVYMFFHSACRATEKSGDQDSIMSRFSHASQSTYGLASGSWCSPDGVVAAAGLCHLTCLVAEDWGVVWVANDEDLPPR